MTTNTVITLARKHLGAGAMQSSARLCLQDAIELYDSNDFENAYNRALKSLAYSVGILHPDYRKAYYSSPYSDIPNYNEQEANGKEIQ